MPGKEHKDNQSQKWASRAALRRPCSKFPDTAHHPGGMRCSLNSVGRNPLYSSFQAPDVYTALSAACSATCSASPRRCKKNLMETRKKRYIFSNSQLPGPNSRKCWGSREQKSKVWGRGLQRKPEMVKACCIETLELTLEATGRE